MPIGDGHQRGVHRHRRLAAAHIALQKAKHRAGRCEVRANVCDRAVLRRSQGKRKPPTNATIDFRSDVQNRRARVAVPLSSAARELELPHQQFIIGQSTPPLSSRLQRLRAVNLPQGRCPCHQLPFPPKQVRQRVVRIRDFGQAVGDDLGNRLRSP